jgi:hypothetical protein
VSDVDAAPPEPPAATNRGLKLAVIALAALSLFLAILSASLSAKNRDTNGRTAEVRRAAGAMGTAMLSYDYHDLSEAKRRVLALSTGKFKQEYRDAFNSSLDELYKRTEGVSKVRDVTVYVSDVTASEATAIVEVDYLASGLAGKNRPATVFLELSLVRSGDKWLVDNVRAIETPQTPTTAP